MLTQSDSIVVKRSIGRGRGVFARRPIKKDEVIETAPVLVIPPEAVVDGRSNKWLSRFYFEWGHNELAVCLGFGSLYNHSYQPNAIYEHGYASITFRALVDIPRGEEIFINYNCDPDDKDKVSFKVVERNGKKAKHG